MIPRLRHDVLYLSKLYSELNSVFILDCSSDGKERAYCNAGIEKNFMKNTRTIMWTISLYFREVVRLEHMRIYYSLQKSLLPLLLLHNGFQKVVPMRIKICSLPGLQFMIQRATIFSMMQYVSDLKLLKNYCNDWNAIWRVESGHDICYTLNARNYNIECMNCPLFGSLTKC